MSTEKTLTILYHHSRRLIDFTATCSVSRPRCSIGGGWRQTCRFDTRNYIAMLFVWWRFVHSIWFLPHYAMRKRGLCCRLVSLRPSVCHVSVLYLDGWRYRETFVPAQEHIILVFWLHAPIPISFPSAETRNTRGGKNLLFFDWNHRLSQKQYEIGLWLLWNINRKS